MTRRSSGFSLLEILIVVAIMMVLIAFAVPQLLNATYNYRINGSARQVQALVYLGRVKATSRNSRYRLHVDTTATPNTYELDVLCGPTASAAACTSWSLEAQAAVTPLPTGVSFSTSGLSTVPPLTPAPTMTAGVPDQATDLIFNSRGLLLDPSTDAGPPLCTTSACTPANGTYCFYLQGTKARPIAICTVLTGRTTFWRLNGATWEEQ